MKGIFGTVLIVSTVVLFFPHEATIQIFGVTFNLSSNISLGLKIILILAIFIFFFGTCEEIKKNNVINEWWRLFHKKFRGYIEAKNGKKIDNLKKLYPQINKTKDIYFIENVLVVKTSNITNNDSYEPCGYTLQISKMKYYFLLIINAVKASLNFEILPYVGLLLGSLLIVIALLIKLAWRAKELM
jgi:hypothetical protein